MKEPKRSSAIVQLVRIYVQSDQQNRRLAQAASFGLAAASFAGNPYPGGDHSPESSENRTNRALQVLESYLSSPDEWNPNEAFTFGFIGLLPHIGLSEFHSHSSLTSKVYAALEIAVLGSLQSPFTVPASYTWLAHLKASCLPHLTKNLDIAGVKLETIVLHVLLMQNGFVDHKMLVPVLAMLRHAQTKELQVLCMRTLFSISISRSWVLIEDTLQDWRMLRTLFQPPGNANNTMVLVANFVFRLLLANIMLCNDCDLAKRQSMLNYLLKFKDQYEDMNLTTQDRIVPSEERILEHVAQNIEGKLESECMRDTLQLVLDFCKAKSGGVTGPERGPMDSDEPLRWAAKLETIKKAFISGRSQVDGDKCSSNPSTVLVVNRAKPQARPGRLSTPE
ncbi:hypothetical protein RhiLY_07643 [Ceratobasidium sp. AG-Ba]|nr:hypothetical protein RhiLY_07643 [Ceratobasidium sp. AG-Ba]